ncbi:MAG: hypothetical protein JWR72_1607 [Flavisolibacter sp.]|jgi:acid phosphatase class B|nr:hypothetical protein [Flavisolibacter sp.]
MEGGSFTRSIYSNSGTLLAFLFTPIRTTNGKQYYIVVIDDFLRKHDFWMKRQNGNWRIVQKESTPVWIIEIESKLDITITEAT